MTTDYQTRIATPDDAARLDALLLASYSILMKPVYGGTMSDAALQLMSTSNPVLLASGTYYVAEVQGNLLVGSGGWTRERPGDGKVEPGIGHVRHFATHPDWTGKGIGRAIYQLCETNARSAQLNVLECFSSLNAEVFYSSLGFERVEEMDVELTSGVNIRGVFMRRSI